MGLGDSSYPKFNFTAKKLHKRLIQLGAQPLMDVTLCDEQDPGGGSEAAYARWAREFFGQPNESIFSLSTPASFGKYKITYLDTNEDEIEMKKTSDDKTTSPASENDPFLGELVGNTRMTSDDHWQDVRLIEIECGSTNRISYECGDVCVLRPANTKANMKKFLETFQHINFGI